MIALQLFRWSDASYLESQDMLRMSGIERDVYLYAQPKVFISDYYANTNLDNSYANGIFNGTISISNTLEENSLEIISSENEIELKNDKNKFKIWSNYPLDF